MLRRSRIAKTSSTPDSGLRTPDCILNRFPLLSVLLLALLVVLAVPGLCMGVKYKTTGAFTDASGGQHPWSLDENHTYIWDGEPYIPVGGAFVSKCITAGPTEGNYAGDVKALETLKAKGIMDIVLKGMGPITSSDPVAWQKILSYLDDNGFTYGIEMDDGPKDALKGYIIAPNVYKVEGPSTDTRITCDWPDVDSAVYVVLKRYDNSVKSTGGAIVRGGKVMVNLAEPLGSGELLFVYPHRVYKAVAEGGVGDMWSGFSEYRDRVLAFFKSVKLGKGMRFFLEPFTSKMDFTGDNIGFLPDSPGFRLGFEAYLSKKYIHEGTINTEWAMSDNLGSVEQAARLTPLWIYGRGTSVLYDRANAKMFTVDPSSAQTWRDIWDYRDTSAQGFMNTISDTLKKQVANVPVIFKCSNYHRVYATPFGIGGFDGLDAQAYGTGEGPITKVGGPAYSLAEECGKTTWYIASPAADGKSASYASESELSGSLDLFREVGCKGFFIDSLMGDPRQLDWLGKFKAGLKAAKVAEYKPDVVYYPSVPATGAYVKRLAPNTWWLPTLRVGETAYIGDGMSAYAIAGEDRSYAWSGIGDKALTFKAAPTGIPIGEFPRGVKIGGGKKADRYIVTLNASPTVLRGQDVRLLFPLETAEAEIERLAALIPEADKNGLDVKQARAALDRAKTVLGNGQFYIGFGMAQAAVQGLLSLMGADVWLEGEQAPNANFGSVVAIPGASDGLAQVVDTADEPVLAPYSVSYRFNASSNLSYEIWVAGTPPAEASPISYCVDDDPWTPVSVGEGKAEAYAPGLAWYKIGAANLFPGSRTLKLKITGKRPDGRYHFAIDAVVLSPKGFKPDGVKKPF